MSIDAHRWLMTAPKAPFVRAAFQAAPPARARWWSPSPAAASATPTSATSTTACAPTMPLPLALGHEISGRVVEAGAGAEAWLGSAVIVPAVLPCGECDLCRRGLATICRGAEDARQRHPGRLRLAHRGAGARPVRSRSGRGSTSAGPGRWPQVSIVADALTTPYQAVRRAGVTPGSLAIVVGAGGVGGYCVQVARAFGATVVAIDVDDGKLAAIAEHGASLTLNSRELDAKAIKSAVNAFAKQQGLRSHRVVHLRMLGQRRRPAHGLRPAGARRHAVGGRLHHGQGRAAPVQPDGFRRARARQLGLPARVLPGRARPGAATARCRSRPSSRTHPLAEINDVFAAVHRHDIRQRVVLVP